MDDITGSLEDIVTFSYKLQATAVMVVSQWVL